MWLGTNQNEQTRRKPREFWVILIRNPVFSQPEKTGFLFWLSDCTSTTWKTQNKILGLDMEDEWWWVILIDRLRFEGCDAWQNLFFSAMKSSRPDRNHPRLHFNFVYLSSLLECRLSIVWRNAIKNTLAGCHVFPFIWKQRKAKQRFVDKGFLPAQSKS